MANEIIASRKASAEDNAPVGPYSRIAGPNSITFCGGVLALARSHQVDTSGLREIRDGLVVEAKDAEGHIWYVRSIRGFISAFRDRTRQELEDYIDECNSRIGVHFQKDRLVACRLVTYELMHLVDALRPERCDSRKRRRLLKRRMLALTVIQQDLLSLHPVSMRTLRQELGSLNLALPQRDHWAAAA